MGDPEITVYSSSLINKNSTNVSPYVWRQHPEFIAFKKYISLNQKHWLNKRWFIYMTPPRKIMTLFSVCLTDVVIEGRALFLLIPIKLRHPVGSVN